MGEHVRNMVTLESRRRVDLENDGHGIEMRLEHKVTEIQVD